MISRSPNEARAQRALRVGVLGASGTTGAELVRLLCHHPLLTLAWATSREYAGQPLTAVDPSAPNFELTHPDEVVLDGIDLVFVALPHGKTGPWVKKLLAHDVRVVDLSGDHRLRDAHLHGDVYGSERDADAAAQAVYGLTELARESLAGARLVANPGCYPTCCGLPLAPLAARGVLGETVIVDAKSGISGAGRGANANTHFLAVTEDLRPYKLGRLHRHAHEIDQVLADEAGAPCAPVTFCPHVLPIERGMLATIYLPTASVTAAEAHALLSEAYANEPFVEVLPIGEPARIRAVTRSPRAQIGVHGDEGCLVLTASLDNLMKGAASQALQNANLMLGLEEYLGLLPFAPAETPHLSAVKNVEKAA